MFNESINHFKKTFRFLFQIHSPGEREQMTQSLYKCFNRYHISKVVCIQQIVQILTFILKIWISLVAQMVKNLPAMQETRVQSLGWEDLLEKGMATHSSFLAWRIAMDKGACWATVHGVQRVGDWATKHTPTLCIMKDKKANNHEYLLCIISNLFSNSLSFFLSTIELLSLLFPITILAAGPPW